MVVDENKLGVAATLPKLSSSGVTLDDIRGLFQRQLDRKLHPGAALAVYVKDKLVLDLFAGFADWPREKPVQRNTMFVLFSSTKPLASMSVWLCADRGLVDLDAPIAKYWPGFAKNGKERVTPRMVLAHTGGFPKWPAQLKWDDLQDWDKVVAAMEDAAAEFERSLSVESALRILDIVEQDVGGGTSIVIHGRVTELVDVGELVGSLPDIGGSSVPFIETIGVFE